MTIRLRLPLLAALVGLLPFLPACETDDLSCREACDFLEACGADYDINCHGGCSDVADYECMNCVQSGGCNAADIADACDPLCAQQ